MERKKIFIKIPKELFRKATMLYKEFTPLVLAIYFRSTEWIDADTGYCETSIKKLKEMLGYSNSDRQTKRVRETLQFILQQGFLSFGSRNGNIDTEFDIAKAKPRDDLCFLFNKGFFNNNVKKDYSEISNEQLERLFYTAHEFRMEKNTICNLVNVFFFIQCRLFLGTKEYKYPIATLEKELRISVDTINDCLAALEKASLLYRELVHVLEQGKEYHYSLKPFKENGDTAK